jgi:hypothetical protein
LVSTSSGRSVGYNNHSPRHRHQPTQTTTHSHNRSPTLAAVDLHRQRLINQLILSPPSVGRTSSYHFTPQETHRATPSCCLHSKLIFSLSHHPAAPAATAFEKPQKTRRLQKAFKAN